MTDQKDIDRPQTGGARGYLRIATEEAFAPPEMVKLYLELLKKTDADPGFESLMGFYLRSNSERARFIRDRLQDLGALRLADMDARGIDMQVIGLTCPGTQIFDPDRGDALAQLANNQLAEACAKYPERFVAMAACAPQNPQGAAREIERAVRKLGMKAVIINSHIQGEYLDNPKFSPVLEAAQALDVPIYLHPNTPPKSMIQPMLEAGLDGAIFGFGVETGMHALRLITSGTLDRFPRLRIILGHMGEALPFWMYRLDYMHRAGVVSKRYETMKPIAKKPSDYLRENFYIANSGMAWAPAIRFTQENIGVDRVVYAMDYPYQCPVEEVVALDGMTMSLEDKKKFFELNARTLFKL
jgi:5-carboxyvanillate decarboxylase